MQIKPQTKGSSILLDKLQKVDEGQKLENTDIEDILDQPDIQRWLEAYEWIDKPDEKFRRSLQSLRKEQSSDLDQWEKRIDDGLRMAMDDIDQMRSTITEIEDIDWRSVVQRALKHLPEETKLDPDFIVTVDGFNGGMFKNDTVFLSVVYFDASHLQQNTFAHEFHHMGAEYWWDKNQFIKEYERKEKGSEKYLIRLFKYLVGEGLANAYCSPSAVKKVREETEGSEKHNDMIMNYEEKQDRIFDELEEIINIIVNDSGEGLDDLFEEFTMDKENMGLPPGHFLSGRMFLTMKESQNVAEDEIKKLVKDPFDFFKLYNIAAEEQNERKISPDLVDELDSLIENLKDQ